MWLRLDWEVFSHHYQSKEHISPKMSEENVLRTVLTNSMIICIMTQPLKERIESQKL